MVSSYILLEVMTSDMTFCTGEEHVHALDIMEEDEPVVDDSGPALVLRAFSDNEIEENEDTEDW